MLTSGFLGSCWCGSWCLELKKLLYFPWIKCDLKLLKVSQCVTLHAIHLVRPSPSIIFISQLNLFHSWINLIVDLHTPAPPTPQCCCFKSSLKELINFTWFVVYILLLNLILLSAKHSGVCTWRVLNVSDWSIKTRQEQEKHFLLGWVSSRQAQWPREAVESIRKNCEGKH